MTAEFGDTARTGVGGFWGIPEAGWDELMKRPLVSVEVSLGEIFTIALQNDCWVLPEQMSNRGGRVIAVGRQREGRKVPAVLVFGMTYKGRESVQVLEEQVDILQDLCSGRKNDVLDGARPESEYVPGRILVVLENRSGVYVNDKGSIQSTFDGVPDGWTKRGDSGGIPSDRTVTMGVMDLIDHIWSNLLTLRMAYEKTQNKSLLEDIRRLTSEIEELHTYPRDWIYKQVMDERRRRRAWKEFLERRKKRNDYC